MHCRCRVLTAGIGALQGAGGDGDVQPAPLRVPRMLRPATARRPRRSLPAPNHDDVATRRQRRRLLQLE